MAGVKHFDFFELFRHSNGRFITRVDHVSEFVTIRGLAARGTLETDAGWLLERSIIRGGVEVEVEYANDAQFTEVWDDRLLSFTVDSGSGGGGNLYIPATRVLGGSILNGVSFDAIGTTYPTSLIEVYRYYTGGLAGALQATITVTYLAADKKEIVSAVRT